MFHFIHTVYITITVSPSFILSPIPFSTFSSNGWSCCCGVRVSATFYVTTLLPLSLFPTLYQCGNDLAVSLSLSLSVCQYMLSRFVLLSFCLSAPLLIDGHGGVDVSGEAFVLAPLNSNLATPKDNAITSLSLFPSPWFAPGHEQVPWELVLLCWYVLYIYLYI